MLNYKNEIRTNANSEKVWKLYADVSKWSFWDTEMEKVELHGDFISGTTGIMHMNGMPPLPFQLANIKNNTRFTVVSSMGNIEVSMDHILVDHGEHGTTITHTVDITGENEQQIQGIGIGITKSIPASMERLSDIAIGL